MTASRITLFAPEIRPVPGRPLSAGAARLREMNTLRKIARPRFAAAGLNPKLTHRASVAMLDLALRAIESGEALATKDGLRIHKGGAF